MYSEVVVSIICATYNHENYIERALEGFISQETQYNFEVLVYDDASVDKTTEIIKKYEEKYPDIIKPIYQKENKHSKGEDIAGKYIVPNIHGRFVANCDGDDYWTDKYKIQKQVMFLLEHPDVIGCVTNAIVQDLKNQTEYRYCPWKKNRYISVEDVVYSNIPIMKPSTWMIRAEDFKNDFDVITSLGGYSDSPLQLWMLSKGKVYYMKDCTIVYRQFVPGSWTDTHTSAVVREGEKRIERFNQITGYKYDKFIQKKRNNVTYRILNSNGKIELLNQIGIKRVICSGCWDLAVAVFIYRYIPLAYNLVKKMWRKMIHED